MAGRASCSATPRSSRALAKLKSYLDYGTFQPVQIAATVTMNEAPEYPKEMREIYQSRRDVLCDGLNRIGWEIEPPKGTMFVWAPIPEPYAAMGSIEFAKMLVTEARGGRVARHRLRPRRRGLRALRAHRERAAHPPGRPQHQAHAGQARRSRLTIVAPRRGRAIRPSPVTHAGAGEDAVEHEGNGAVGHLVGRHVLLVHEDPHQLGGHAQDGVGDEQRVGVADEAQLDAVADVAHDVLGRHLLALAQRRQEPLLGDRELGELVVLGVLGRPAHGGAHAELDAADRIGGVGERLLLGAAQILLGLAEDLEEQLLLAVEVPVEDALADPEALDDLGHAGRVVPVLGEPGGGELQQLAPPLLPRVVSRRFTDPR